MNHEIEANLINANDEAVKNRLGISNFHDLFKSYTKILYNHSILTYDDEAIYMIDKLNVTFKSSLINTSNIESAFYKREPIQIDDYLIMRPNFSNGNNYHFSFNIEYCGNHFGCLHLKNTKKIDISKIELDNRMLYERSIFYILSHLFHLAETLDLTYSNINTFDIARDTTVQLYKKMSEIYYQSDKCNQEIYNIYGCKPKFKPITKSEIHDYTDKSGIGGSFTIGTKKSECIVRIYDKTPEIASNNFKKEYINQIHAHHFGNDENISRAEVSIMANAFRPSGILGSYEGNLIHLLLPENLTSIYFKALGEKLTFKILSSKRWDVANNDKYEKIAIIPRSISANVHMKQFNLKSSCNRFSHYNNIYKYKFKIVEYLDNDIPFHELKRYLQSKTENSKNEIAEALRAWKVVQRNYNETITTKKHNKIETILLSLGKQSILNRCKITFMSWIIKLLHFNESTGCE